MYRELICIFVIVSIYQNILLARKNSQKLLAVLIDPEKIKISTVQNFIKLVNQSIATHIFVGGSKETTVEKVSHTKPISQLDSELILKTALASEFSGKKVIYLEAGSGATVPVESNIITLTKSNLTIPLIVGGGIKNISQINDAYDAGADMLVIGTAFEKIPHFLMN